LAGEVGLLHPGGPVVGPHVAIDVEEAAGVAVAGEVRLGQAAQQLVGAALAGELV
jgi:hypothetical protein